MRSVFIVTKHKENFKPGKTVGVFNERSHAFNSILEACLLSEADKNGGNYKRDERELIQLYNTTNRDCIPTTVYLCVGDALGKLTTYFTVQEFQVQAKAGKLI